MRLWSAAIPAVHLADTIKEVDERGAVARTVDRATLRAVQTPQVFRAETLRRAHDCWDASGSPTDDAQMGGSSRRAGMDLSRKRRCI